MIRHKEAGGEIDEDGFWFVECEAKRIAGGGAPATAERRPVGEAWKKLGLPTDKPRQAWE